MTAQNKITGWRRVKMIRELASGTHTRTQLAAWYGVNIRTVSKFAADNAAYIAEVVRGREEKEASLWIAERDNRIAEYAHQYELAKATLEDSFDPAVSRAAQAALHAVAEELGHLRQQLDVRQQVNYTVEGVDLSKLQ